MIFLIILMGQITECNFQDSAIIKDLVLHGIVSPSFENSPESWLFTENNPELFVRFRPLFKGLPMVIAWPIATMIGQSRVRIKTHAALRVGIRG